MWNVHAIVLHTNEINHVTWVYTLQTDGASLGGGDTEHSALPFGSTSDVTVPSMIGKHAVVEISSGAFANLKSMRSVVVPESVQRIHGGAFAGCSSLTNMVLPFVGCSRTPVSTSYEYGTGFYDEVFGAIFSGIYDSSMAEVGQITSIGLNGNKNWTSFYLPPNLESVTITDEEYLFKYALMGISMQKSLGIPSCLKKVGSDVIWYSGVTDIHIPDLGAWCNYGGGFIVDSDTFHPRNLYVNGELLKELVIPSSVTEISYRAFACCTNLTSVVIPPNVAVDSGAFIGCSSLSCVVAPCNLSTLFGSANLICPDMTLVYEYYGYRRYISSALKAIDLSACTEIATGEFTGCSKLEEVFLSGRLKTIQDGGFADCGALKKIYFYGNAPTVASASAFNGVNANCTAYVRRSSTGWGVSIPGTWNGIKIAYFDCDAIVIGDDLPHATDGVIYSQQLTVTGGEGPYLWSMDDASDGVTLSEDGLLVIDRYEQGITTSQQLDFNVTVSDLRGLTATQNISVVLDPNPNQRPVIEGQTPDWGYDMGTLRVGTPQTFTIQASDPEDALLTYTWYFDNKKLDCTGSSWTWTPQSSQTGIHWMYAYCSDGERDSENYCLWYIAVDSSEATATESSPVPVPYDYFSASCPDILTACGGDYEAAANALASNGVNKVWECYVAGISPTNAAAQFVSTISVDTSGTPTVKWIPDLNEDGAKSVRTYHVFSRKTLGQNEDWVDFDTLSEQEKKDYNFFKVTVEMK